MAVTSLVVEIAEAVADSLNGASFSQSFTAVRSYHPDFSPENITSAVEVRVVPGGVAIGTRTRGSSDREVRIDIAILARVDSSDNDDVDPLMTLVEEIVQHLDKLQLVTDAGHKVAWLRSENDPIFSPEELNEESNFQSLISTYFLVFV